MKARRILIIEDDPEIRLILSMLFRRSGMFEPILACDGVEGIELARKQIPDIILVDAKMPRMDGYTTCKLIKKDKALKDIPVIFLTAKTDEREIELAMESGACGLLTKPFDPLLLAHQVSAIADGV